MPTNLRWNGSRPWKTQLAKTHTRRTRNPDKSLSIKEIESINNNFLKEKTPIPIGFTGEFYQTCKEKITQILSISFRR